MLRLMSHLHIVRFCRATLYRVTKLQYATVHVTHCNFVA